MTNPVENLIGLLILAGVPFSFVYYGKLIALLRREGGLVRTDWVGLSDLPMALTLGGALAGLAVNGLMVAAETPKAIEPDQLIPGMIFLLVLAGGITVFLAARKLPIASIFGLQKLFPPIAAARGFVLLLAAVPAVATFSIITAFLLREAAQQQELVRLFSNVSRERDINTVLKIVFAGIVIAPVCEEILFRGYFYPVAKRYLGPAAGALLTAALFAVSHVNLASLPGLLALAVCFIIAYERTGSLLVPICMHAIFNATNLLLLYVAAQSPA